MHQAERQGGRAPPQFLVDQLTLSRQGGTLSPPITTCPPRFFDFGTCLISELAPLLSYLSVALRIFLASTCIQLREEADYQIWDFFKYPQRYKNSGYRVQESYGYLICQNFARSRLSWSNFTEGPLLTLFFETIMDISPPRPMFFKRLLSFQLRR